MEDKVINTIRLLSLDMVDNANSGHPGMPLGCAPLMYVLWTKIMCYHPYRPLNINRDRFILSNGHGCALLYSILYLLGFNYTIDDLKNFRKLNSKTPGHPEYMPSLGIETTTGPLGQGISNGVGMAIASKNMKLDNTIYVMCGDGCLMEGISYESCSLAGHLELDNLILLYDDNNITIDGNTDITFNENIEKRFVSMNWSVFHVEDGNRDYDDIYNKIILAKQSNKPSIVIVKTIIGYNSPLENTNKSHGAPFGEKVTKTIKIKLGFDENKTFIVDDDVKIFFEEIKNNKLSLLKSNNINPYLYCDKIFYPKKDFNILINTTNSKDFCSTRELSGKVLEEIIKNNNHIIIGSADLSESNKIPYSKHFISKNNYCQPYLHYGVREHAMVGIANGISTFNILPIVGTFLMFINYCLPSIRLAALSKHKVIYVFTHDSVFLGEDGPTHQPIESLTILRSIPNLITIRPCNFSEVKQAYCFALKYDGPTAIILSRQPFKMYEIENIDLSKGAYVIYKEKQLLHKIIIATGSEIPLAIEVAEVLKNVRVVSMPSCELFDKQSDSYKNEIFPKYSEGIVASIEIKIISIEAGSTIGWYKYANYCYGIDCFGSSGNLNDLKNHFHFTKEELIKYICNL